MERDGGGVFVGVGGGSGCDGSTSEYSDVFPERRRRLDSESEDSDGDDEWKGESSPRDEVVTSWRMVSALEREVKRPEARG